MRPSITGIYSIGTTVAAAVVGGMKIGVPIGAGIGASFGLPTGPGAVVTTILGAAAGVVIGATVGLSFAVMTSFIVPKIFKFLLRPFTGTPYEQALKKEAKRRSENAAKKVQSVYLIIKKLQSMEKQKKSTEDLEDQKTKIRETIQTINGMIEPEKNLIDAAILSVKSDKEITKNSSITAKLKATKQLTTATNIHATRHYRRELRQQNYTFAEDRGNMLRRLAFNLIALFNPNKTSHELTTQGYLDTATPPRFARREQTAAEETPKPSASSSSTTEIASPQEILARKIYTKAGFSTEQTLWAKDKQTRQNNVKKIATYLLSESQENLNNDAATFGFNNS